MFRKMLMPDLYKDDVNDIDYKHLASSGIKLLIFDIDNTLKTYEEKVPSKEIKTLFDDIRKQNIDICLLSNGRKSRVKKFNEEVKLNNISLGLKPLPFGVFRMMRRFKVKKKETALIGDQIFTDVLCGKLSGVRTILVKPIKPRKKAEKIRRKLEKSILKLYNNH